LILCAASFLTVTRKDDRGGGIVLRCLFRIRLGLRENWPQFSLLVLINAFVGGMVGLERTVVPLIGAQEFKIASTTIVVSFIVSFGVVKAIANRGISRISTAASLCSSWAGWSACRFPS
jgi:hypothetical protein